MKREKEIEVELFLLEADTVNSRKKSDSFPATIRVKKCYNTSMPTNDYMNLLKELTLHFDNESVDFALIGAFAMAAYGYVRATCDIDFVIRLSDQKRIIDFMENLGFDTLHRSDGYSNHWHPVSSSQIDFVYVTGSTADELLDSAETMPVGTAKFACKVVTPVHFIALKLFAIKNNKDRKLKDLADIREIVHICHIDNEVISRLLNRYGLEAYYNDIV